MASFEILSVYGKEIVSRPSIQKYEVMLTDQYRLNQINHWMVGLPEGLAKKCV